MHPEVTEEELKDIYDLSALIPEQVIPESVLKQPSELKKKRIIKWVVVSVLIAIGLAIIIVILSTNVSRKREATYNKAVEITMQGNWKDAIDTFESLNRIDYKGARDFYLYCKGKKQYEEGDLKAAYKTVGQTMLKDVTPEQREFILDYFFELDDEYHRRYGYDLPSSYKPSNSSNSSSSSGSGRPSSNSGHNTSTKTDPYNAKDYANEDDFWEDYYNEFIDFDEAEQYWDAHH
ncbi:MAG: hypothetical protein IKF93_09055 [Lachnospiraceae bacterium]|nr:hypothetical protein [Lachnospiraceae bacterium]